MRKRVILILSLLIFLSISHSARADVAVEDEIGCVYDTDLNISWTRDADLAGQRKTWSEALTWVRDLAFDGFDDWRLPSIKELEHINKVEGISPSHPGPFENLKPDDYWSSTEYDRQPRYAWSYTFAWRHPHWGWRGYHHYVWAVRNGQCQ